MHGNGSEPHQTIWQHGPGPRRALARLYFFAIAIILIVGMALAFYAIFGPARDTRGPWVSVAPLTEIRNGGGVWYDDRVGVFVVVSGPQLVAFSAADTASPERVYYCPSSRWFETPTSGSKFDHFGFYREGSVARGLDRVPARAENGVVSIRPSERSVGPPVPQTDGAGRAGPSCTANAYSINAATGRWEPILNAS
ncbi:MAG: hypothetical protein ACXVQX_08795 [Actinomycetota bacterium]